VGILDATFLGLVGERRRADAELVLRAGFALHTTLGPVSKKKSL